MVHFFASNVKYKLSLQKLPKEQLLSGRNAKLGEFHRGSIWVGFPISAFLLFVAYLLKILSESSL